MPHYSLKLSIKEYKQSLSIPHVYLRAVNFNSLAEIVSLKFPVGKMKPSSKIVRINDFLGGNLIQQRNMTEQKASKI